MSSSRVKRFIAPECAFASRLFVCICIFLFPTSSSHLIIVFLPLSVFYAALLLELSLGKFKTIFLNKTIPTEAVLRNIAGGVTVVVFQIHAYQKNVTISFDKVLEILPLVVLGVVQNACHCSFSSAAIFLQWCFVFSLSLGSMHTFGLPCCLEQGSKMWPPVKLC